MGAGLASPDDAPLYKERMLDYVSKLDVTNQELYVAVDYTQLKGIVDLYTVPSIVVEDLVPGTYVNRDIYNTTQRSLNLVNGIVEFVVRGICSSRGNAPTKPHVILLQADVRRAYTLPVNNINISDPETFWVSP